MFNEADSYVQQLTKLSGQKLVLGFVPKNDWNQCREAKAVTDLISVEANIPLGDYNVLASKVKDAIGRIIEYLDFSSGIRWKWYEPPWRSNHWQIDVQESLEKKTSWIVHMGSDWSQARSTVDLTAGLSLWMYSLVCGKNSLEPFYLHEELEGTGSDAFWKVSTPGTHPAFQRIIGSSESSTVEEMKMWMGAKVYATVPSYDGKWNGEAIWKEKSRARKLISDRPVFGLYYSTSFE